MPGKRVKRKVRLQKIARPPSEARHSWDFERMVRAKDVVKEQGI